MRHNTSKLGLPLSIFLIVLACIPPSLPIGSSPARENAAPITNSTDTIIYDDALAQGIIDGSWGATIDPTNTNPTHSGSASIAITINGSEWGGLFLQTGTPVSASNVSGLHFWIHGGPSGGQTILVKIVDGNNGNWDPYVRITPQANTWTEVTVKLSEVGKPASIGGIVISDGIGNSQPTFYVDDISLLGETGSSASAPTLDNSGSLSGDDIAVYTDSLLAEVQDLSWGAEIDLLNATPTHSGSASIAVTINSTEWGGLFLQTGNAQPAAEFAGAHFWINGGSTGGQTLFVKIIDGNNGNWDPYIRVTPRANTWTEVMVKLSDVGNPATISGLVISDGLGVLQPTFYVDDISLIRTSGLSNVLPSPSPGTTPTLSDTALYTDVLADGVIDGSWGAQIDPANANPIHTGAASMAITINGGEWGGLFLQTASPISTSGVSGIRFWVNGGATGGQTLLAKITDGNNQNWDPYVSVKPQANTWTEVIVQLADVGNPSSIGGFVIQDGLGAPQPTFYIDDITVIGASAASLSSSPGPGPALVVDVAANRHPINPYIYGMNFAEESLAKELKLPVNRRGGNATTRYNWKVDTFNTGSDWYFENIPEENANPGQLPNGSAADRFVEQNLRTGTESLLTIPLIGWVAKSRPVNHPYDCGFKVSLYGKQESTDPWEIDCGNGVDASGNNITGNNPADTSIEITPDFVSDWVKHLTDRFGTASDGGVQFYALDNEPMLWPYTHRDVHPQLTTYDEIRDRSYQYAAAIKAVDPSAQTLGPVLWGWCAYFFSAIDKCSPDGQDYQSHGKVYFVEWYLQQMRAYEQKNGVRILDYLDLHIYPQMEGVDSEEAGNAQVQAARLRSTRQLWDPTYSTEDWIGRPIFLIPQMHDWVDKNYPGTKIAITEYRWGAPGHLNGALAQADILGVFGRESLDLATLWVAPKSGQPSAYAFRMYLNYDGQGSHFGDTSVQAASEDQDRLAIYAAQQGSDNALTLIVINKTNTDLVSNIQLANFKPAARVSVYRYSGVNLGAIVKQPDQDIGGQGFEATFPASSISLIVIPAGN